MWTTLKQSEGEIMKKKIVQIVIIALIICLAAPASAAKASAPGNQSVPHPQEIVDGGWTAPENAGITDELGEIFDKATAAMEDFEYIPVGLIESQIVAGYGYRFLCETREDAMEIDPRSAVVEIFVDLEGNAKVTNIMEIESHSMSEVAAFAEEDPEAAEEMQTIKGNSGGLVTATCTVTFVVENNHDDSDDNTILADETDHIDDVATDGTMQTI